MAQNEPLLIAAMGPTASGKTPLAEAIAREIGAQLINADAFQVYRGLDIGTAKPENRHEYRLLDLKDPTEGFGVGEYVLLAADELSQLFEEGRSAVVVGGTGLYVRALFEDYAEMRPPPDPELRAELTRELEQFGLPKLAERLKDLDPDVAASLDLKNPARVRRALEKALDPRPPERVSLPPFRRYKVALLPNVETTNARIDSRLEKMVQNGWVDEVRRLVGEGIPREAPGLRAIGYRAFYDYVQGVLSLDASKESVRLETRQYAKRQRTWLRSEPNLRVLTEGATTEHARSEALTYIFST